MAAERAVHGDSTASGSSNGYASDAHDHELSNGASSGAITPLYASLDAIKTASRVRSTSEQKLIARGRYLLHAYQQQKRKKQTTLGEMCFSPTSEVSDVEVLESVANRGGVRSDEDGVEPHLSNGTHGRALLKVAAAASVDSSANWLAPSVLGNKQIETRDIAKNEQLLAAIESQCEQLRSALGEDAAQKPVIASSLQSLLHLLHQKRRADAEPASQISDKMTNELLNGYSHTDLESEEEGHEQATTAAEDKVEALEAELVEAKALISELTHKMNGYRTQLHTISSKTLQPTDAHSPRGVQSELKKLEIRVQEKDELLLSLRASLEHMVQDHGKLDKELRQSRVLIERLESEKAQMQKAASDKRTLLHRAYIVKTKQLDLLCKNVELSSTWERVTDENGIVYYRQNDRACAPALEDPRVALALQRVPYSSSGSASPRSASGRMEQTARSCDRKHSSSSFDSTVSCEDIAIPPEDGSKHEVNDFETPLPDGWEMRVTTAGSVFFVNRITNVTTWHDPRRLKGEKNATGKRPPASPQPSMATAKLSIEIPKRMALIDASAHATTSSGGTFDVMFEENGPIGIHFQANTPDAGAIVRRLLPRMAASRSQQIEPFDRLIAVNKNRVDNAPFRYVMLLLQGGLRPLTLTFERDAEGRVTQASNGISTGDYLDEEVLLDDDDHHAHGPREEIGVENSTALADEDDSLLHRNRRSTSRSNSGALDRSEHRVEDYSMADKIITNVFSLFWTLPEPAHSQVETV